MDLTIQLRRLQSLTLLFSCLPSDGKCRELFEMAIALDNQPILQRMTSAEGTDDPRRFQEWVESIWAGADTTDEEHDVIWWQNDADNLAAAINELRLVEQRLGGRWIVHQ